MIKKALALGINFFDTANVYSNGSSEEITGRILNDYANRDEIVLATKVFYPTSDGPNGAGLFRKVIMNEIDKNIEDAVAALSITFSTEEIAILEGAYVPQPVLGMTF